jgi:hypothetical protein
LGSQILASFNVDGLIAGLYSVRVDILDDSWNGLCSNEAVELVIGHELINVVVLWPHVVERLHYIFLLV